jgi:hypothetical protein
MPGILIKVGDLSFERFERGVEKLRHLRFHAGEAQRLSPELAIGWAGPQERVQHCSWPADTGAEVHVWRYGHTFVGGARPAAIGAAEILRDYLAGGVSACCEYEGAFVIVIADQRAGRLYVVPDRLCTQPVHYERRADCIVIGPEVKALAATFGSAPALSREGVVGFLAAGYNLGAQTLFSGVRRLELGKLLEIRLDASRSVTERRFWKLEFGSTDKFISRRDAEDALFQALLDSHRLLLADDPSFQMLLSGGADSRGMLGVCSVIGSLPAKAVTWGLLHEAPRSDASISRLLAERFGVPWEFITTRTADFVDNCEQWAYVSELANDNFGWYTEGFGALNHLRETGHPNSLIGDEVWGWQGFGYSEAQAYGKVLPPGPPASLLALMKPSLRDAAAAAYAYDLQETMRDCADADWTDRKDFLYLHGRVARFIFSLGYYRSHATELRRPYLTKPVLDVVRRLPTEFRVYKNLYQSMLRRRLPQTVQAPYASVNSLPDWGYDLRTDERLKTCFLALLTDPVIQTGVLSELLDMTALRALRDDYFGATAQPMARRTPASAILKSRLQEVLRRQPGYKRLDRWLYTRRRGRAQPGITAQPIDLLRRVAILGLLERQLHRFAAA